MEVIRLKPDAIKRAWTPPDHATSEIASASKLGIDATKKLPGEGFKRLWPPLICMSEEVFRKVAAF